jgi:hypothetical protein
MDLFEGRSDFSLNNRVCYLYGYGRFLSMYYERGYLGADMIMATRLSTYFPLHPKSMIIDSLFLEADYV